MAATISYNLIEAAVALSAGAEASSSALIGFGLASVTEVTSAAVVAWQLAGSYPEAREKVVLRMIASSFFGLAAFVSIDAVRSLLGAAEARHSTVGLALAAASLAVMPVLSYARRRAGRKLGSASAVADSKQTLLCTYLSAVLFIGLDLSPLFGWSWADPVAALVIAAGWSTRNRGPAFHRRTVEVGPVGWGWGRTKGKVNAERMGLLVMITTSRSTPMPRPPVGGLPVSTAGRKSSSRCMASAFPAAFSDCAVRRRRRSMGR